MTDLVGGQVKQCLVPEMVARRLVAFSKLKAAPELEFQFESGFPGGAGRGVGFRGRTFWILQPEGRNWVAVLKPWG